jgi:hypothetical protein
MTRSAKIPFLSAFAALADAVAPKHAAAATEAR